jgi:hypothetical protein
LCGDYRATSRRHFEHARNLVQLHGDFCLKSTKIYRATPASEEIALVFVNMADASNENVPTKKVLV